LRRGTAHAIPEKAIIVKEKILLFLLPWLYRLLIGLLLATCKVRFIGRESLDKLAADGKSWIFGSWHENTAVSVYTERNTGCAMMASDSKDGAIIARGIELCGNIPVRGSSSKGGSKAAKAMVRLLRKGHPAAITPDGPRGPRHELQTGILMISAMSGCPIVPYHFVADRQWVFTSWDRHRLPKPFSNVWISIGKPCFVDRKRLSEQPEAVQREVAECMMENVANAERLAGLGED
jgi:lysophospholipid acyltransferase (LPLAT)-like uncharacterized protein